MSDVKHLDCAKLCSVKLLVVSGARIISLDIRHIDGLEVLLASRSDLLRLVAGRSTMLREIRVDYTSV